jgi:DNA repair protein RecO (recombination protein O)
MALEKAQALVLRTTDWSETSRIATLWTREYGKIRALAKGGRRLKSSFENALDLLTVCSIVFVRKSSGSLDLLTEAQVVRRFPRLTQDLAALNGAYYVAELLSELTQEYDAHPTIYDQALSVLEALGEEDVGPRLARFEMGFLRELGYLPSLEACAACGGSLGHGQLAFSPAVGGVICGPCRTRTTRAVPLSNPAWEMMRALSRPDEGWRRPWDGRARAEVRQLLGQHVTWILGRRPRLLPYLGS